MGACRLLVGLSAVVCSLALTAWGGGAASSSAAHATTTGEAARAAAARPQLTPAQRAMSAVIHAWSARLNAGDYAGIAKLFALPVLLVQGQYAYRLTTRHQVALWHSLLPCSGRVVSISYSGRLATAVFRLGHRKGFTCDAPGGLAAVRFEIVHGKIRSWMQVPLPKSTPAGPVA